MVHREPGADAPRHHAAEARRLPGRGQDPLGRGRERPRADHHAHRRARGGAEGPRPAGRRGRLSHQAVPHGRAARPDQEPAGPLRAVRGARRAAAARAGPRLLRRKGRRGHDDHRDQRGDRAPSRARPQGRPRRRQPPVRRPPRLPRPGPRPPEHRGRGDGAVDRHRPHPADPRPPRLGRGPAARAAVAGDRRARDLGAHAGHPRPAPDGLRLHPHRHRQEARRDQPADPRPGRHDLRRS